MKDRLEIAGYCRISVDEELDRDNVSIENQKAIIRDFVQSRFPQSNLTFYEDRDRSGYTFAQREGYQTLRRGLMAHGYDILVVKDFSRFSRRNSRGLVELEDLRDAGVRIISVGDGIDFPADDDWLKIQFQFLLNEMPVTDTSRKVRSVIRRRQEDGRWICAAPYGYVVNKKQEFDIVPAEAEVVRRIYALYLQGWGYRRIADRLTEEGIPTPRMAERERKEAAGEPYHRAVKTAWAIVTVQGILDNDFYTGTLRQGKYVRQKINGRDVRRDPGEQIVIEGHHRAVIDGRTFAAVRALRASRSASHYRGVKKYDNVYSGYLECGDCGSPMFAMSRPGQRDAYRCGAYHRRGRKACTSHHIRADKLDELLKAYVRRVQESASAMLEELNGELARAQDDTAEQERGAAQLEAVLAGLREELRVTKRQRVRDVLKHPEQELLLEQTYDAMESELLQHIAGTQKQLALTLNRRDTILRVNRAARSAGEVFDAILQKEKLDRNDLEVMLEKILVYEDRIEVRLKADVDALLCSGTPPAAEGTELRLVQSTARRPDKVLCANVVSRGDPLEIYTDKDGEVIFKKYSPMGELSEFANHICAALHKTTDSIAAVCDRDAIIAVAGGGKRELLDRRISPELEQVLETRGTFCAENGICGVAAAASDDRYCISVASPILSEGDVLGGVLFLAPQGGTAGGETEQKLASAVAGFLGRQMEN